MRNQYGTAQQLLDTFKPELQLIVAKEIRRTYFGKAPFMRTVALGYGNAVPIVWLCEQLENLNNFVGAKEKMSVNKQKELAKVLLTEYSHLRITEFLLFFYRLKCGRYGRFYGAVDALTISAAMLLFMDERRKEQAQIKELIEKEQRATLQAKYPTSKPVTYEEYLELKKQKEEKEKLEQLNQKEKEESL